jgi:hypothetical protein
MAIDQKAPVPFSFDDIYSAADRGELIDLFMKIDDSGLIQGACRDQPNRDEIERAFADATEALRGREMRKTGVGDNPLCMVMAIVLEAIQQNFQK